jgi:hypothetical protein
MPLNSTVLDLHLVWHPQDASGEPIASEIEDHFLRQSCTGLHAGAIEVHRRSVSWTAEPNGAPRPIALPGTPDAAAHVAVVVLVGTELMRATQPEGSPWGACLRELDLAAKAKSPHLKVMAILLPGTRRPPNARLSQLLGDNQYLAEPDRHALRHGSPGWIGRARCRELAQTLSCWLDPENTGKGIQVFISHTKYASDSGRKESVGTLVRQVRAALGETRLGTFYDAQSLQPGQGWAQALTSHAGRCALLVLRTDLYATREWCHREVIQAKENGRPVVVLDALGSGEARGSYLLDHVPRVPVRSLRTSPEGGDDTVWSDDDIEIGVNRLVDAWLERVLWERQAARLQSGETPMPHAPELLTLMPLLKPGQPLKVVYPDPPLSDAEKEPLRDLAKAMGCTLDLTTPRMMAVRPSSGTTDHPRPLTGLRLGLSTSTGSPDVLADLARLGLTHHHHDLTLRAIARAVLVHGGTLAYGGNLEKGGCTPILMDEVERYAQQVPESAAEVDLDGTHAPLWLVLSWSVHRHCTLEQLRQVDASLSLHGRLRCLDKDGEVIDMAAERQGLGEHQHPAAVCDTAAKAGLTAMRGHLDRSTQARVLLGGRREGYTGHGPGLLEEATLALKANRPVYLIGGLGGITAHMVAEMDPDACAHLASPKVTLDTSARRSMNEFLSRLDQDRAERSRWAILDNGLSDEDNRRLATSNRPAEIAALICRGMAQRQSAA